MTNNEESDRLRRARQGYEGYLRYLHLGLVMAGIILGFTLLGQWLDGKVDWKMPVFTIVLSLLGVAGAMLYLFKETGRR